MNSKKIHKSDNKSQVPSNLWSAKMSKMVSKVTITRNKIRKIKSVLFSKFLVCSRFILQMIGYSIAVYLMCLCMVSAKPSAKPDAKPDANPQIYFPYPYYSYPYYTSPYSFYPYNYYYYNNLNSYTGTGGYNGQVYKSVYPYLNSN